MKLILALALLLASEAYGQTTCAVPPAQQPRDSAFLSWPPVTMWDDGTTISAETAVTYIVYEMVNGTPERRCTTRATSAALLGLSDGKHTWVVTAMTAETIPTRWGSSEFSNEWSKTIGAPPAPVRRLLLAPMGLTGN